ncbi:phospholipase B1, membrane-associated-like [Bombus vancouverensis nearcticus]|uniref:phospholipase B1, membrane-associated-like n=1 Tax=Bombus vancouverensis nearcticus TaxID=2705178 RepID=UPI00402BF03A
MADSNEDSSNAYNLIPDPSSTCIYNVWKKRSDDLQQQHRFHLYRCQGALRAKLSRHRPVWPSPWVAGARKVPESVQHSNPGDIDVIAAMGDSLTIGARAISIYTFEVNIENRDIVGSVGVQGTWRQYLTLPNILKVADPNVPESVHRLRPGDIDVIAAMGDSLTADAGIFATNLLEVLVENRGASASIGGEGTWRTYLTLLNIFKQEIDEEVADYPEFHRNYFTVEILPTLKDAKVPLAEDGFADLSYLTADCFHSNQKLHALYASNLWNNLLEPVGNKSSTYTTLFKKCLCPTSEKPFLMTYKNSQNNEN